MSTPCLTPPVNDSPLPPGPGETAGPGAALSARDRAEIGHALAELLGELHAGAGLRPRPFEGRCGPGMEVDLVVPGTGGVTARVYPVAEDQFELSISGSVWEDMVVLREAEGRLSTLYREYFWWRADEEKRAKDRLMEGFNQLRWVKSWGVAHSA
jgi:hypothetical protein